MSSAKTISFQGYTATVREEQRYGLIGSETEIELPARVTAKWLAETIGRAEAAGADRIALWHNRYLTYSLRHIMRQRSGWYRVVTTYSKADGWKPVRRIVNDIN